VFGEISSGSGVLDTLEGFETVNGGSPVDELPVNDRDAVIARGSIDLETDAVTVRRVAVLMKILPLTIT